MKHAITFGRDKMHEFDLMLDWCATNIGRGGALPQPTDLWFVQRHNDVITFNFRRPEYLELFKNQWQ
jgi:hypothetical protein